jgi:serine phosphatase RsbU (regulator of sigma subunit)
LRGLLGIDDNIRRGCEGVRITFKIKDYTGLAGGNYVFLEKAKLREAEITLSPGDTIMLMSDGLPELFNEQSEIFDYDCVKAAFAEAAPQSPRKIIEHFVSVGEAWANGRGQQDDMTFIVLKVK